MGKASTTGERGPQRRNGGGDTPADGFEEGQRYRLATKGVARHGLGAPHPHVLARLVLAIAASATGQARQTILEFIEKYCKPRVYTQADLETQDANGEATQTAIDNLNNWSHKAMRTDIAKQVQVFGVRVSYEKKWANLAFASRSADPIVQQTLLLIVNECVDNGEGEHRFGTAPPKQTERQIGKLIESLEEDE